MTKFKFPHNLGTDRENPFEDERGANPFADQGAADAVDENPYGPSGAEPSRRAEPGDYVTMLPDRSGRVFTFGVLGIILAVSGIAVVCVGVSRSSDWASGVSYGIPIQFLGLAVSLPAWILGANDLKAIRAGAMVAEGRKRTRIGLVLGVLGVSIGTVPVLAWFGLLIEVFWYS